MASIGIYHGDEDWVLKGIAKDLAKALRKFEGVSVESTDQVFKGKRLESDFHVYVQQGQLNQNCKNMASSVPSGAICLFTHLDINNFRPDLLSRCKGVIFNSSIQLSMAIANGYDPSNAYLRPHAVDSNLHKILSTQDLKLRSLIDQLARSGSNLTQHSAVGFCGRYWDKTTYVRRKNYQKIKKVALYLAEAGIPVVVLGPGWSKLFPDPHPLINLVSTKYANYPFVYNLMKIFVSLSVHEGGPLPVLESMCCGVYPIATNTGFAFDVLRDRQDGILLDPFRSSEFIGELVSETFFAQHWDIQSLRQRGSQFSFDSLAALVIKICRS